MDTTGFRIRGNVKAITGDNKAVAGKSIGTTKEEMIGVIVMTDRK